MHEKPFESHLFCRGQTFRMVSRQNTTMSSVSRKTSSANRTLTSVALAANGYHQRKTSTNNHQNHLEAPLLHSERTSEPDFV